MLEKFIAIEGIDTSVLNEQAEKLSRYLRDELEVNCVVTREPSDGPIGAQLRLLFNERVEMHELPRASLFLADRLDQFGRDDGLAKDLESGKYVISIRYLLSAYAYQSEVTPLDWIIDINKVCRWPDVTVFIDTTADSYLARRVRESGFDSQQVDHDRTIFEQSRQSFIEIIKFLKEQNKEVYIVESDNSTTIHNRCKRIISQEITESAS